MHADVMESKDPLFSVPIDVKEAIQKVKDFELDSIDCSRKCLSQSPDY